MNTNGAGDTHRGALVASMTQGHALGTAVRYANQQAALVIQRQASSLLEPSDFISEYKL